MKYFLLYIYYRLYQWSEKREKNIPLFIVVGWITITLFLNVVTMLSLVSIFTGIDAGRLFRIHTSNYVIVLWLSLWGGCVWLGLKLMHVHEAAFSESAARKYKEIGCKDWWVVAYFMVSYLAMGSIAWVAGDILRMHK